MTSRPAMEWGFYPLWFWNAEMAAAEIRWQVGQMAAAGIKGFFIHPRQGLGQPYMSAEFLDQVEAAIDEAGRLGLSVHLGDEFPYPSGAAGGEVALGEPQFAATVLVQQTYDVAGGPVRLALPQGRVLACVACPLDGGGRADWSAAVDLAAHVGIVLPRETYQETGLTSYNRKRYFANEPTGTLACELPPGRHRVFVSVQALQQHHKYWGFFADVMNPAAVERFLALTHERYAKRFPAAMGTSIRSFFLDETAPSWSALVPSEFARRCGYDLLGLLPALQDAAHPRHLEVLADLRRVQGEMFTRSFDEPIARWCRNHGVACAGERPSYRLSQLRWLDIPGCEPGHTKAGAKMDLLQASARGNARATASAAYFYGKAGSMCECYHSLGWGATLQDARLIADGLLLWGIQHLVPHAAFYSTHSLRKHDAPPSFFFQMPWWQHWPLLAGRVNRIGEGFEGTHIDAQVLLVDPSAGLPDGPGQAFYQEMIHDLAARRIDFMMVDTDILQEARIADGRVNIRDVQAKVVVVPPMRIVEPELRDTLAAHERAGAAVVWCNDKPLASCMDAIAELAPPAIEIASDSPGLADVQAVRRCCGGKTVWLLLNTGAGCVPLRIAHDGRLWELPLEQGASSLLTNGPGLYERTLAPFEAVLLTTQAPIGASASNAAIGVAVGGEMKVTPLGPNLLRLYEWEMSLPKDAPGQRATVAATPLVNQLAKGGFRIAPRVEGYFGDVPQLNLPLLEVRYETSFQCRWPGRVELVMEPDSIGGDWSIVIGGRAMTAADFAPSRSHVRGSLGVDVTELLRPGLNSVVVTARTDRTDGGLRNALYLAGDFGVDLAGPALVNRPAAGGFETYRRNRLPYYAGAVEYAATVHLAPPADGPVRVELALPSSFEEACEVSFNGGPWHASPWSPRCVRADAAELRRGPNALRIRVQTTLIRAFEGQYFDPAGHRYRDVAEEP